MALSYQNYTGPISLLRSLGSEISTQISSTKELYLNGISLDAVMNSFNGLKEVAYNNFYLLRLMLGNASSIQQQGRYDNVLRPIVKLDYFNNKDYFTDKIPKGLLDSQIHKLETNYDSDADKIGKRQQQLKQNGKIESNRDNFIIKIHKNH